MKRIVKIVIVNSLIVGYSYRGKPGRRIVMSNVMEFNHGFICVSNFAGKF